MFKQKKLLIKLHGDLNKPDSVVITKDDYKKFSKNIKYNCLITDFISQLSKRILVICGVSFKDKHFIEIIKSISNKQGEYRNKLFLVTPNITKNQKKICKKLKLEYINATFEELVSEVEKIYNNNLSTFKDRVDPHFLAMVYPTIKINNGTIDLKENINKCKVTTSDKKIIKELSDFINHKVSEITIDFNNNLVLSNFIGDALLYKQTSGSVELKYRPLKNYSGNFKINNNIIENIEIKVYAFKPKSNIIVRIIANNLVLDINMDIKIENH